MTKELKIRYIELARKLGKLPTRREVKNLLGMYIDNFGEFKKEVLKSSPELEELAVPMKVTENDIESYRLGLYKSKVKKNNNDSLATISFLDHTQKLMETIKQFPVSPVKPFKSKKKTNRILNIVFSDVHIGADLNQEEVGSSYSRVEESRRVAAIVQEVINYKTDKRDETELEVLLLGDLMQGQLHDPRDGAPLAEQICRVIHIFSQALLQLAANFKQVRVRCATGNHSRNTARHKTRAVNQKWDSYETVIYFALKTALKNQQNVEFFIPKAPYGEYEVFGQKILYTHGDTFLNPGYPGKSINIKSLEAQINTINASLSDTKEFQVAVLGHVHVGSQTYLSNGCTMLTNGALIDPDSFAVSIGIIETQTGQMLFESTPEYAIGDSRFIRVGKKQDKDESLDLIVKPWENL